jgi:hypothetical protein
MKTKNTKSDIAFILLPPSSTAIPSPTEPQKQVQYNLYPNPVKSQVHISGHEIPSERK